MSGGLMAPLAQMLMARSAGKHLARVFSYAAAPVLLGPLLGPVLAGVILQHATILQQASWRWLFLVNVPLGLLAIALAIRFLPDDRAEARKRELDFAGFLLLSPGLVLFLYGADHIGERVGLAALSAALVLLVVFVKLATAKGKRALIDLQLFSSKVFSASAVTQFLSNGIGFAGQMMIPIYLIRLCGRSPAATGWLMAPLGLGMLCSYPQVGRLTERFGIRTICVSGAVLSLAGTLPFLYLAGHGFSMTLLAAALFVRGVGMSGVGIPSITSAYASVKKEDLPMATTSLNIVQRLGGPTLTTVCATFLGWRLAVAHLSSAPLSSVPAVNVSNPFVDAFMLLCFFHALLLVAAFRLPLVIVKENRSEEEALQPAGAASR
jgi:MFS family permease